MLVGYIFVPRWEMPFTFIGFMILEIRIQQNDRLPTDFLFAAETSKLLRETYPSFSCRP